MKELPKFGLALAVLALVVPGGAAEFNPQAARAFDQYITRSESRMDADLRSGLLIHLDRLPALQRERAYAELRRGTVLVEQVADADVHVPGALIHHWRGTAMLPHATLPQVLALVQDYEHLDAYYGPDVMRSRLLERDGDHFRIFMRLHKHKVVTAILDTEYDVRYFHPEPGKAYSQSYSTRIAEVDKAGKADERQLPAGEDHGFMWRLNSYWRFRETGEGVLVECEAISLTRNVPAGLGWLIGPFIQSIPQESLRFTLTATRDGVLKRVAAQHAQNGAVGK